MPAFRVLVVLLYFIYLFMYLFIYLSAPTQLQSDKQSSLNNELWSARSGQTRARHVAMIVSWGGGSFSVWGADIFRVLL